MRWQSGLIQSIKHSQRLVEIRLGGHDIPTLLEDYPYLNREDIMAALRYAAWLSEERDVELVG